MHESVAPAVGAVCVWNAAYVPTAHFLRARWIGRAMAVVAAFAASFAAGLLSCLAVPRLLGFQPHGGTEGAYVGALVDGITMLIAGASVGLVCACIGTFFAVRWSRNEENRTTIALSSALITAV